MNGSLLARLRFGSAVGQLVGFGLVAVVNAIMIAIRVRIPKSGLGVRVLHHAYDAAQLVGLGVVSALAVWLWQRSALPDKRRRALGVVARFLIGLLVGTLVLRDDFRGFAGALAGDRFAGVIVALGVASGAAGPLLAAEVGRRLARGAWRIAGALLAAGIAAANHLLVAHDYPGVHFFAVWCAAVLAGSALADDSIPARGSTLGWLALPAVASSWSFAIPPSNAVRLQLFRTTGSVVAPFLARIESDLGRAESVALSAESARWFTSRSRANDVPPSGPRLFADDAIVLLLVVDAGRADLLHPRHAALLPNLNRLARESVLFENARSPAPGTTLAVTSLFFGRYPSQIRWTVLKGREYPPDDMGPRFSELLSDRGVLTLSIQSLPGLMSQPWGILRGFREETLVSRTPGRSSASRAMVPPLIERLARFSRDGHGALFAYQHYDDAHAPYTLAGARSSPFEAYLAEIAIVDAEIGRLLDFLHAQKLWDRTTLIVTADHGEAFLEHGKQFHATTLYDEVIRIPLMIRVPGISPRRVRELVSLIDLGPTLLDGFGIATPGSYMGESLVPFVRGRARTFGRPIVAESDRGHRALVLGDGFKLISDDRLHTLELYDLGKDPGELDNLADDRPDLLAKQKALLDTFTDAHRVRR